MDRAAAFHEAKWRMYKLRQNYEKAKHHAARARYYRTAFGTGPGGHDPWFAEKLAGAENTIGREISTDHRLCVMSYFEFYNRENNAYVHMWPAHEEDKPHGDWRCPFHVQSEQAQKKLFDFEFTETNVRNLVESLSNTTQWVNERGTQSLPLHAASVTDATYFKFGLNDVLGWLLPPQDIAFRRDVSDICAYLNSLVVDKCDQDKGQWRLHVKSTANFSVSHLNDGPGIFCRPTPKPQRAMDVIPIILRTGRQRNIIRVETTIGTRNPTEIDVQFTQGSVYNLNLHKDGCSEGHQVGAGEHLEKGEYKKDPELKLVDATQEPSPKLLAKRKLGVKGPIFRALKEEVGLPEEVVGDGKVFLLGTHTTDVNASVGRDARYWPRIHRGVVYGYPRETSTALSTILMHHGTDDPLTCKPGDEQEVKKSELVEWGIAFDAFQAKQNKPAFGYAHEMMVQWVDLCLDSMIAEYIRPVASAYSRKMRARS